MDLVIAVLLVIAVQLVMFLVLRGRIHQELNATSLLKDVRDEVDGMVRELNLSAERNIGLLEARIEELEELLARADQKMVLLAREVERRERTTEVYSQLKRVTIPEPEEVAPEVAPAPVSSVPEVIDLPLGVPVPAGGAQAKPRSLNERVLDLRDQGLGPGAIATATGATRGEVELILSLNPRG